MPQLKIAYLSINSSKNALVFASFKCYLSTKPVFTGEKKTMQKTTFLLPFLAILLSSCASSERLTRMSGDVFSEYSAPQKYRIRSEKYQAKSRTMSSDKKISHGKAAKFDDTLINIWPFFFASNNYWCALWPMIDCDPYGFAVRPLFNKEGNDLSILFPLSAWNTHNRSGWFANFTWGPNAFGFIPLTWQSKSKTKSTYYYTPLFFLQKRYHKITRKNLRNTDYSFFCALAYGKKERFVNSNTLPHSWILSQHDTKKEFQNQWAYFYRNGGEPQNMPKDKKELEQLKEKIFRQYKKEVSKTTGFFPLFHLRRSSDGYCNFVAGPLLFEYMKHKDLFNWSILGGLAVQYTAQQYSKTSSSQLFLNRVKDENILRIPLLLTQYKRQTKYAGKRYELFEKLKRNNWNESFTEAKPRLSKILHEIYPGTSIPKEVKDWNTFYLYKTELTAKENFPTTEHKEIFAGPLFFNKETCHRKNWIVPVLLTWGEETKEKKLFVSVPMLTFIQKTPNRGYTNIVPPLICWSDFELKKQIDKPIHASDCKWSGKHGVVEEINHYAALGLFYRGRHAFTVAKNNIDSKKAEFIRKNSLTLGKDYQSLADKEKNLAERQRQAEAWQTANKIEYYKKLIRFEELKEERQKLAEQKKKYDTLRSQVKKAASKLGLQLADSDFKNRKSTENAVAKLLAMTTELRWKEDIGNGLFFRKEKFYNGDYNWHFCHILAGGKKEGNRKSSHILHLLYRSRQEENRTETIVFPFISHVKDGNSQRTSFMWRLFSIGSRNGKTGGHFLFIPFGEKL